MRVTILCAGSLGEVAPYTGLAAALKKAGHDVTMGTFERFRPLVEGCGARLVPVAGEHDQLVKTVADDPGFGKATGRLLSVTKRVLRGMESGIVKASEGADLLLLSGTEIHGYHVATAMGIPSMGVPLYPLEPTREFPLITIPSRMSLGALYNRGIAWLAPRALYQAISGAMNEFRADLGLPTTNGFAHFRELAETNWPIRGGFSKLLVQRPADWRSGVQISGFWWPAGIDEPDQHRAIDAFLAAGDPPIFINFGTLSGADTEKIVDVAFAETRRMGHRIITHQLLSTRWADDPGVLRIGTVSYQRLFPRMAGLVHSCGAGLAGEGLRAGIPAVTVPMGFDRPFWASRLAALGASPQPIGPRSFNADVFRTRLTEILHDGSYRRATQNVGELIRVERGEDDVVSSAESLVS